MVSTNRFSVTGIRGSLTPNTHLQTRPGMHPQPRPLQGHTCLASNKCHPFPPSQHREYGNVTAETCISKEQDRKPNRDGSFRHATRGVAPQTIRAKHSGLGVMPRPHMQVANQGRFCSQSLLPCGDRVAPRAMPFLAVGDLSGIFEARLSLRAVYALSWIPIL